MRRKALWIFFTVAPLLACAALGRDETLAQSEQAFATDAAVDSALEQCVLKQVGDRLQRCCRTPGAMETCYDIANGTQASCGDAGPDGGPGGMVGNVSCPGQDFTIPFNLVYVAGKGWCAVKTEGAKPTIYACHPNPDDFLLDFDLACTIAGVDADGGPCPCTIRNVTRTPFDPLPPSMCSTQGPPDVTDRRSCQACCTGGWRRECSNRGYPNTGEWQFQCLKACDEHGWTDGGAEGGADAAVKDAAISKAVPQ
jgi:hypothetical protein